MNFSYRRWTAFLARRHRVVLGLSAFVCLLAALSVTRLRLDIDVLGMLPEGEPAFDDFKLFVDDFGRLDELFLLVEGGTMPRLERLADELAQRLAGLDAIDSVHARVDRTAIEQGLLGKYLFNYLSEDDYEAIRRRLSPAAIERQVRADRTVLSAPFDLAAARAIRSDPLGLRRIAAASLADDHASLGNVTPDGRFAARDGGALLIFVRPQASPFDIAFCERLLRDVHRAVAEVKRAQGAEDLRVAVTGSYVYALEDKATMRGDIVRYVVLALAAVLLIFLLGYRSLRILPFVTYPLLVTTLLAFASSLLLFDRLNAVSLCFAAILYGLSIDTGIHFYTRLLAERRGRPAEELEDAVAATLRGLARANLTGTTTTAAAFFAIGLSVLSAVRQLGILTAVGMIFTGVQFFLLYPALAFALERGPADLAAVDTPRLQRWARGAVMHSRSVLAVAALVSLVALAEAASVRLDTSLTHLRPSGSAAARVDEEIARRFGRAAEGGAIIVDREKEQAALADAERVAERLRVYQHAGVVEDVQSLAPLLPSADAQRARLAAYDRLPRKAALASLREALRLHGFVADAFEEFFADFARPRNEIVYPGDAALRPLQFLIDHHLRSRDGRTLVATHLQLARSTSWPELAERLRRDLDGLRFHVASRSFLEDGLGGVLREEIRLFAALGLLGNLLLLRIGFGRIAVAAAVLCPTLLALVAVLALMAATGTDLDPVNLIVIPLVFGIGVDDAVYLTGAARETGSVVTAVGAAGRALVVTSLTTIAGFGFLGFSRYPPFATLGALTAVGLTLSLACSVLVLPALLALVGWEDRKAK